MTQPIKADEAHFARPVWMDVQHDGGRLIISVLAESSRPVNVAVELDVQGGSKLHTANRATIIPDRPPVVLSRATVDGQHPWRARLSVASEEGPPYVIERSDRD